MIELLLRKEVLKQIHNKAKQHRIDGRKKLFSALRKPGFSNCENSLS